MQQTAAVNSWLNILEKPIEKNCGQIENSLGVASSPQHFIKREGIKKPTLSTELLMRAGRALIATAEELVP
jgi:hypothetical protein